MSVVAVRVANEMLGSLAMAGPGALLIPGADRWTVVWGALAAADAIVSTADAEPASADYGDEDGETHGYDESGEDDAVSAVEGECESTWLS